MVHRSARVRNFPFVWKVPAAWSHSIGYCLLVEKAVFVFNDLNSYISDVSWFPIHITTTFGSRVIINETGIVPYLQKRMRTKREKGKTGQYLNNRSMDFTPRGPNVPPARRTRK